MSTPTPPVTDSSQPAPSSQPSHPSAWQPYAKAIMAFVVGALGALGTASATSSGFSRQAVIGAVIAGLLSAAAVYQTPNQGGPSTPTGEGAQPPTAG